MDRISRHQKLSQKLSQKLRSIAVKILFMSMVFVAQAEMSGASIDQIIEPYPRSQIVYEQTGEKPESYRLVLGMLKKINNKLEPENKKYLLANRKSTTYYIADEQRTEVVYLYFRRQLLQKGELIFECDGRECGSSSFWANKVFNRSILYGPDKFQHYMVALFDVGEPVYVLVYTAQRGNKKIYAHLEILSDIGAGIESGEVDVKSVVAKIKSQGKYGISSLLPDDNFENLLVAALAELEGSFIIVGHSTGKENSVESEIERTQNLARSYLNRLIAKGVVANRVTAYGVGPLSPIDSLDAKGDDYLELVWMK